MRGLAPLGACKPKGVVNVAIVAAVLIVVAVLAIVLVVNAIRLKPTPVQDPLPESSEMGSDEAVERFREILRSKTVWAAADPDADHTAFDEFVPKLRTLYPRVFEACELEMVDTYGISLLWKGEDCEAAPIVLMAHHDVVEADPAGWSHDPFAAEIADGKIYARGAVDTKCIWAALMEAAETLIAEGYVPPRDVYFFSSNTEEDGGDTAPHMVERLKEIGRVPYMVLDEGGALIENPPLGVKGEFAVVGRCHGEARVRFGRHPEESAQGQALRACGRHAQRALCPRRLRAARGFRQPVAVPPHRAQNHEVKPRDCRHGAHHLRAHAARGQQGAQCHPQEGEGYGQRAHRPQRVG